MSTLWRQLSATIKANIKSTSHFKSKLIIDLILTIFRVFVLLLVYMNIYKIAPQAGAILPYKSALWSIGAYFFLLSFNARRSYQLVSDLIYTGSIEMYLVRPMHVILFSWAQLIGSGLIRVAVTGISIAALLLVLVGVPNDISIFMIMLLIIFIALGVIIELLIGSIVGLTAVWLENAKPLYLVIDKFILIFGGSYVPIAFFPLALQYFSKYSPFGATRFASLVFYPNLAENALVYLAVQFGWIGILTIFLRYQYRVAQRHIFVNGS
jgi:ABC-2 type transport system permease protein